MPLLFHAGFQRGGDYMADNQERDRRSAAHHHGNCQSPSSIALKKNTACLLSRRNETVQYVSQGAPQGMMCGFRMLAVWLSSAAPRQEGRRWQVGGGHRLQPGYE